MIKKIKDQSLCQIVHQKRTAEPDTANMSDPPISDSQENAGANSTSQHAPQVEPGQKRYIYLNRVRQPTPSSFCVAPRSEGILLYHHLAQLLVLLYNSMITLDI